MLDALWEAECSFGQFDADGSGYIDIAELRGVFSDLRAKLGNADEEPLDEAFMVRAMAQLDLDRDGVLSFDEYLLFLATPQGLQLLPAMWRQSYSAVIAELDVSLSLGRAVLYAAQDLFEEADVNGDNMVDRVELQALLYTLLHRLGSLDSLSPRRAPLSLKTAVEALPDRDLDFQEFVELFCTQPFSDLLPGGPLAVKQLQSLLGDGGDDQLDDHPEPVYKKKSYEHLLFDPMKCLVRDRNDPNVDYMMSVQQNRFGRFMVPGMLHPVKTSRFAAGN